MTPGTCSLVRASDGRMVVPHLVIADRFWLRLCGLWGRASLPPEEGLLLVPCASVHTIGMRFAIDAIGIERDGVVVAVRRNLAAGKFVWFPRGTYAVLECAGGTTNVAEGERLAIQTASDAAPARWASLFRARL